MLAERVGRLARALRRVLLALAMLLVLAAAGAWAIWNRQGLDDEAWADFEGATVEIDAHGVPTITAESWPALVEAQGYVTAANRLFQMDLMRRGAGGRLAAWFGEPALQVDEPRRQEDWSGQAAWLAERLPADERRLCDAYAAGVNRFIEDRPWGWGLEYAILRVRAEPWSCPDTMLLLMAMASDLSSSAGADAERAPWMASLPPEWARFLFPADHPWNVPMFGAPTAPLRLPGQPEPPTPADGALAPSAVEAPVPGSNNWAWAGATGSFVANDPHLGARVPHLWFLVRLRVKPPRGEDEWAVGATIPGLPGVVLGMNARLAWAFTNVGEDVDDYLLEQVSEDGGRYLARRGPDGAEVWQEVERRPYTIEVKGAPPREGQALFTHRGPLARRAQLGQRWASRAWLPLQRDSRLARLATVGVNRARDLDDLDRALDAFTFPAQNVVAADAAGNLLYRASGTGVQRAVSGDLPADAVAGEWLGLEPASSRPRLRRAATEASPAWIATANERIWNTGFDHRWADDGRAARIRERLDGQTALTRADMEALQLDTYSRYHHVLVRWAIARHAPQDAQQAEAMARWASWDGHAAHDPATFTEALALASALKGALLAPVVARLPAGLRELPYSWRRSDAWILATLGVGPEDGAAPDPTTLFQSPESGAAGFAAFGLQEAEVAAAVVAAALRPAEPYPSANRWTAQHPFVGRVPVLGDLFRIPEPEQLGHDGLVRTELPKFGASLRFVWDLRAPGSSTWITPVGQSGHVRSPHYRDLQAIWREGARLVALPPGWPDARGEDQ